MSTFRLLTAAALSLTLSSVAPAQTTAVKPAEPPPAGTGTEPGAPVPVPVRAPRITFNQCYVDGPYIAMTYDDGPHGANTPRLLEMLRQRGLKATFFVCGECVAALPEITRRIADDGHEIANHSWSHPQLTKLGEGSVTEQLQRTHDIVKQITGVEMKVMRPPYGAFTNNQRAWAHQKWGYKTILWDVDPLDWKIRSAAHVTNEILKRTVNGSIVLAHDIHKSTVDAMPATLDGLLAKGFKFVTVSELIALDRPRPTAPVPPKPATAKPTAAAITE